MIILFLRLLVAMFSIDRTHGKKCFYKQEFFATGEKQFNGVSSLVMFYVLSKGTFFVNLNNFAGKVHPLREPSLSVKYYFENG